jgi:hypothetical protein
MRVVVAALLALALVTSPAAADEPHMSDGCGDGLFYVQAQDETVVSPDPLSPSFDIDSADVTTVRDIDDTVEGVDFTMDLCGDAVEPESYQGYTWRWVNEAGCRLALNYGRETNVDVPGGVEQPLTLSFTETCDVEEQTLPIGNEVEDTFSVKLDPAAVTLDGRQVTIAMRNADLPAEAAHTLVEGTRLAALTAGARVASGPTAVFVRDPEYTVHASTGGDSAVGGDWVIGQ